VIADLIASLFRSAEVPWRVEAGMTDDGTGVAIGVEKG
jgi:hypothetical protein